MSSTPRKVDRLFIIIYLLIIHLEISIENISMVLSCEPQPNCRMIRPKCITILYCTLTLFIDISHFKVLFLCCFGLFYTVCNFPVPKQQKQDSAVKSGHQVS